MARMEFQHHPLVKWPRAETPAVERRGKVFRSALPRSLQLLAYELASIGAINPILITTDHQNPKDIRIDGLPREDVRHPRHPGVILEFYAHLSGKKGPREKMQYACDRYDRWTQNLHAIMMTLEALRAVDRYGATAAGEQYAGFKSLPPPGAPTITIDAAATILAATPGVGFTAQMILGSKQMFIDAYRTAAKKTHPDAGGSPEAWASLQQVDAVLRMHHQL